VACWRILSGPLKGRRLVTSWREYPTGILGTAEKALLAWLAANVRNGEVWLDIGANSGYTAIQIAQIAGREGKVYAFEPIPDLAGNLFCTARANAMSQIIVVPMALGETQSITGRRTAVFSKMADPTTSPPPDSPTIFEVALDSLWPNISETEVRIAGIKVDVNGSELSVLRGMRNLLTSHKPKLAIEIHNGVNRTEFLECLRSAGYDLTANIDPSPRGVLLNDHNYEFLPV
jgi:FkbM family methyltransferase